MISPSYKLPILAPKNYKGYQEKYCIPWVENIKPDFSNLQFHSKKGELLNSWIEYYSESEWADIWVALPAYDDYITYCWGY